MRRSIRSVFAERRAFYLDAWRRLRDGGFIYPCTCSRKDLAQAASAPNDADDEPIYPGRCRGRIDASQFADPAGVNWRFRLQEGDEITFADLNLGPERYVAGRDFGDFLVWRRDDVPAYQLAVVVDDAAMRITEVVRGADLLKVHCATTAVDPGAGIFHSGLLSLRTGARPVGSAFGQAARCTQYPALAGERDVAQAGDRDGPPVLSTAAYVPAV